MLATPPVETEFRRVANSSSPARHHRHPKHQSAAPQRSPARGFLCQQLIRCTPLPVRHQANVQLRRHCSGRLLTAWTMVTRDSTRGLGPSVSGVQGEAAPPWPEVRRMKLRTCRQEEQCRSLPVRARRWVIILMVRRVVTIASKRLLTRTIRREQHR